MELPDELKFMENALKPQKTTTERLDGKVCVLTGATSGIGYHTARRLAQGGAELVLVCRNPEKAAKVQAEIIGEFGTRVNVVIADFSKFSDVHTAAENILQHYPHIDILINNAGIHATKRRLSEEGIESVFCVDHLASFLFTRLLLPRLRKSAPARIIDVNSEGHRFNGLDLADLNWDRRRYKGLQGYGAAKTAQLLTVWQFAEQLEGSGVTINAMHPGAVRSNIGMDNGFLYRFYQRYLLGWFLKDPLMSANDLYTLAAAPDLAQVSGKFFNQTIEEKPAAHALDTELGRQVWQISEEMTGLVSPEN